MDMHKKDENITDIESDWEFGDHVSLEEDSFLEIEGEGDYFWKISGYGGELRLELKSDDSVIWRTDDEFVFVYREK